MEQTDLHTVPFMMLMISSDQWEEVFSSSAQTSQRWLYLAPKMKGQRSALAFTHWKLQIRPGTLTWLSATTLKWLQSWPISIWRLLESKKGTEELSQAAATDPERSCVNTRNLDREPPSSEPILLLAFKPLNGVGLKLNFCLLHRMMHPDPPPHPSPNRSSVINCGFNIRF